MGRHRSPTPRAPQTDAEALDLCARFAEIELAIGDAILQRNGELAAISAAADAVILPLQAEQETIFKQLKIWFPAHLERLTGGKRKSHELGGCTLGFRLGNATVKFGGGTDDVAAAALMAAELAPQFVRTKHSPDKPALLRVLEAPPAAEDAPTDDPVRITHTLRLRLEAMGFRVHQGETFYVDPIGGGASTTTVEAA